MVRDSHGETNGPLFNF